MNSETSYAKKAEKPFIRFPDKFEAAKKVNSKNFRRLIILANFISTVNCLGYFFGYVDQINFWRIEMFAVQSCKMLAEVVYNKFGLDLFVHHTCMFLFYFLVPETFLWLGPQGNMIHIPFTFQNLYFLCRHDTTRAKLFSGLFWTIWLPIVAYRNSIAFFLGAKYILAEQAFGRVLIGLGALGATLDVFWTREFLDAQISIHPEESDWARSAAKFYLSPLCLILLGGGSYMAHLIVWKDVSVPRLQFFLTVVALVLGLNWRNLVGISRGTSPRNTKRTARVSS
eukprot:CAMPEP_0114509570 /NCGR_PEP_ID=MMETSP0109-20121206/13285_1 /TAXON_ID=29199 /ORGANISM="Chlorarachnion reptans, Strain CCCM449" /LENGTH=282 /DNA_ID=CAMNT_0001688741 /DNA_START=295 /DNA_END=1143 /DNA_ORIENTATION=+